MTKICRHIIDHPSAWTVPSLGGKASLLRPVTAAELDALDRFLARTRHKAPQATTREDFADPALLGLCGDIRSQIMEGRGALVVSGLSPDRYSEEDDARIYWGIGTQLGTAAIQSYSGDRLGYVQQDEANATGRGYRSQAELKFHTDSYEIVGLMCVRSAYSGGDSRLVSAAALHNEILRTRPELLEPLYEGYYYALTEIREADSPLTEVKIPVFCHVDGKLSLTYNRAALDRAAAMRGEALPPGLVEAREYLTALCERPDLCLQFLLEPGEILLWHNFMYLHSRTAFENKGEQRRLLLRLWLTPYERRPVDPALHRRAACYDRAFRDVKIAS